MDYEHNLSNDVFLTYLQNSQISPNSSKFCSFLAKSERFKRLRTDGRTDGRTHTLFKFEALLHKKPLRGKKISKGLKQLPPNVLDTLMML